MKKHPLLSIAARAAAFLLLLALLLAAASYLFLPKDNQKSAGMDFVSANGYLGEPENSLDVLFLGDSMTYSAYSPLEIWDETGIASYVSAVGSGRMNTAYETLTRFLRSQQPSVVVLEAHVAVRYTPINDALVTEASLFCPLFENHDHWKTLSPSSLLAPVNYTYRDDNKGFRPNRHSAPADHDGYMAPSSEKSEVSLLTRFYLERVIRLCQENGITLLLVGTPSPVNWDTAQHNSAQAIADQYDSVEFLDLSQYTEEMGLDWDNDFRDGGDHLNLYGAQKASAYLSRYLAEHYSLPDHREDSAYAAWDAALEDYRLRMGQ